MFATVTPHQSAVSGKMVAALAKTAVFQHGLEEDQVCKATIPGLCGALDVDNGQGPDGPPGANGTRFLA